jgi:hypothetical protein
VKLVVGFAAGDPTDTLARLIARSLSDRRHRDRGGDPRRTRRLHAADRRDRKRDLVHVPYCRDVPA